MPETTTGQMAFLAGQATRCEARPEDAAALLVDAAALLAVEAKMPLQELIDRLFESHATIADAFDAVQKTGVAAARKQ